MMRKLFNVLLIGACIIIIINFLNLVNQYAVNLPIWDDFDSVLNFLIEFTKASDAGEKFALFYKQHNEHRILINKFLTLADYWIFSRISLLHLIYCSTFALIALGLLIGSKSKDKFAGILLGASIMLQPQYGDGLNWVTTSVASFFLTLIALLCSFAAYKKNINPFLDSLSLLKVYSVCKEYKFDIVHTHTSKPGVIGRIAARLAGVKSVIHTIHGFAFHAFSSPLQNFIYKNLEKIAAKFCDLAISVNEEDRLTAISQNIISSDKIKTITNGIDPGRFNTAFNRDTFRSGLGLNKDDILVGNIGRMAEQKDPLTFIKAAKLLTDNFPNAYCIFLGDGPLFEEAKNFAASLNLGHRLILPGFKNNPEDYLRAFDIFVINSLWEGMPYAVLEAMCAGLPIVATDIKGIRECVDQNSAVLIEPSEPDKIFQAVEKLIKNPELSSKISGIAQKRFFENFTQERMLSDIISEYSSLLRNS